MKHYILPFLFFLLITSCIEPTDTGVPWSDVKGQWVMTNYNRIQVITDNGDTLIDEPREFWEFGDNYHTIYERNYQVRTNESVEYNTTSIFSGEMTKSELCQTDDSEAWGKYFYEFSLHQYSGSGAPIHDYGVYVTFVPTLLRDDTLFVFTCKDFECADNGGTYIKCYRLVRTNIDSIRQVDEWVFH